MADYLNVKPLFSDSIIFFKNIELDHKKTLELIKNNQFKDKGKKLETSISQNIKILDGTKYGKQVRKVLDKYIAAAIDVWGYDVKHQIVNSWASETKPNCSTELHSHLNFWLSAVYYPYSKSKYLIYFQSDRPEMSDFSIPTKNWNPYNSRSHTHESETGDLLIFSAKLKHKIPVNYTNEKRYSLAINILPKGEIGISRDGLLNT